MADRSRARRGACLPGRLALVPVVLVVLGALPWSAGPARAQAASTPGPVRFEAGEGTTIELGDGRRFLDTVELRLAPDGSTVLVNELGMDDYVAGVAEMPPRWPLEALKAQAVAARTYAWWSIRRGTFERRGLGYDICATVACQVFRGAEVVEESSHGDRWRRAVRETSGQVLLEEDGGPILARYFSTSGGRTLPNEAVFPSSGPRDYLVGTEDPDDGVSPLHRWTAEFSRRELDDVFSRGATLADAVPVADIRRRGPVMDPGAEVVVTGKDGTQVTVGAVELRRFVSSVAPERHPERFPGRRADGRRLPATLPSSRFSVEVDEQRVVFEGRGWGHAVGMGQYGARGKALRGLTHEEILAAYYNGLRPRHADDVPERVRVGLDAGAETVVGADGPLRVVAGDTEVATGALGSWTVERGDGRLRLREPEGRGRALEVAPTRLAAARPRAHGPVVVSAEVNKPAQLALRVADRDGATVLGRDLGVVEAGEHVATWRLRDARGQPVGDGEYRVALEAVDEQDRRAGSAVDVTVSRPAEPAAGDEPRSGARAGEGALPWLAASLVVAAAVGVAVALRRRRS